MADCDWIGQREEAILGVSAGISQISNARGSDDAASPFLYLVDSENRVFILPIHGAIMPYVNVDRGWDCHGAEEISECYG